MVEDDSAPIVTALRMPVFAASWLDRAAPVSIAAYESGARFSLRLRASPTAADGITSPASVLLPMSVNSCIASDVCTIARLGPDEWLVLGHETDAERIAADFASALCGLRYSLTDIGHRDVGIAVAGARARDVLNGGCPLDLSDERFPIGSATRTVFGKAQIVLLRPGDELAYRVECALSFIPYVHALLRNGAREFSP